jgi:23S rRNA (cytidine1920-2'-O)/16S rRNA (cytidine1409-2'-O)-methyltransferase
VGKNGVVRDASVHMEVIKDVTGFADSIGYVPLKLDYSPVKGPKGNIEFICMYELYSGDEKITDEIIEKTVKSAHEML